MGRTDSFSCSFWGHRSENWAKKICCHLQNLNSWATVLHSSANAKCSGNSNTTPFIPPSMYVCVYPADRSAFKEHLSVKEACIFLIMKRLSVIHAVLGITVTTLRGNGALFQYNCSAIFSCCFLLNRDLLLGFDKRLHFGRPVSSNEACMKSLLGSAPHHSLQWLL